MDAHPVTEDLNDYANSDPLLAGLTAPQQQAVIHLDGPLLVLAGPLIATLFQSDVFDAHDVQMARKSLMAYSCGLIPFMVIKVLAPGFYAQQDTKTPVKIAVVAMVVNMVMNIILMQFLQQ